jgi:hypothetical protein
MDQAGRTKYFYFPFKDKSTGLGKTSLAVSYSVVRKDTGALVVNGGTASAMDATNLPGLYVGSYAVPSSVDSDFLAYATTTDTTVSEQGVFSLQEIGYPWLANLDATISGRAAAATALTNATWTDARAVLLDNLSRLDATISSIAAAITGLPAAALNTVITAYTTANTWGKALNQLLAYLTTAPAEKADYTAARAVKIDHLDVDLTTRAAALTALDNTVWTNTKAAFLDGSVLGIPQRVWDALRSTPFAAGSIGEKIVAWLATLGSDNKVVLSADAQTGVVIPAVTTVTTVGTVNTLATDSISAAALSNAASDELIARLLANIILGGTVQDALELIFEGIQVTFSQTPAQIASAQRGADLVITRDSLFRATFAVAGISGTRDDLLYTVKLPGAVLNGRRDDQDSLIQLSENDGLKYLNGREAADPSLGTLTYDSGAGEVTIELLPAAATLISETAVAASGHSGLDSDIKELKAGNDIQRARMKTFIENGVARTISA